MEIGNLIWNTGNKNQKYECPLYITALLEFIKKELERMYWNKHQLEVDDIFNLTMEETELNIKSFEWEPYNWNDEEIQDYNFKYGDIEISWYKYFGRDMTINKEVSFQDMIYMFNKINDELVELERGEWE